MKRKMWLVMGAAVALMSFGIAGSLALFTDTADSSLNSIVAGEVCIVSDRNDGDSTPGPMFYIDNDTDGRTYNDAWPGIHETGLWAPGDSHKRTMTVTNGPGCLPAYLESVQLTMQPGSDAVLADKMYVKVFTPVSGNDVLVAEGPMNTFLAGPVLLRNPNGSRLALGFGGNRHLHYEVSFDLAADDTYENKEMLVTFSVNAIQQANVSATP